MRCTALRCGNPLCLVRSFLCDCVGWSRLGAQLIEPSMKVGDRKDCVSTRSYFGVVRALRKATLVFIAAARARARVVPLTTVDAQIAQTRALGAGDFRRSVAAGQKLLLPSSCWVLRTKDFHARADCKMSLHV